MRRPIGPYAPRYRAMTKIITVRISGGGADTDAPSVGDLLDQLRDYFELLTLIEETLAEDGQSAIAWRVINATKVNPLTFTVQAFARQYAVNVDSRAAEVVGRSLFGLHLLEQKAERPPYFSETAVLKAEQIFERVTNGLEQTEIFTDDIAPVLLTPNVARTAARNARSVLQPAGRPYREIGSLEGYFQGASRDGRGRRILHIKRRITGDDVKCLIVGEAEKEIAHCEIDDVWRGRRISVFGTIQYRGPGRISQMEVSKIRFLRSRMDLPDLEQIIDPDFTNGLKSEEYLERLRDGDLA